MKERQIRKRLSEKDAKYLQYVINELQWWKDKVQLLVDKGDIESLLKNFQDGPNPISLRRLDDQIELLRRTLSDYLPEE